MANIQSGAVLRAVQVLFEAGAIGQSPDSELLHRYISQRGEGAEQAFAALVERHGPMVLRVCRGVLRDEHEALDAFQGTFLILAQRARAIRNRGSLGSWLYGVALRVASGARASLTRRLELERRAAEVVPTARCADDPERPEIAAVVHEEIARLAERYRSAVVACDLEGLSCADAADRLGWPVGTVKSRLSRGRSQLRERLTRRGLVAPAMLAQLPPSVPTSFVEAALRAARSCPSQGAAAVLTSKAIGWVFAAGLILLAGTALLPFVSRSESGRVETPRLPLVFAQAGERPAAPVAPAEAVMIEEDDPPGVRPGPSRADVEALLRKISRDPVTPTLINRVLQFFRPRVRQHEEIERVARFATDPDFVGRVDASAGRPVDTFTLVEMAAGSYFGIDDAAWLRSKLAKDAKARAVTVTVTGRVVDVNDGRPIANVVISGRGPVTSTDRDGPFSLNVVDDGAAYVWFYCEKNGYALSETFIPAGDFPLNRPRVIGMYKEAPVMGRVVDRAGRPIAGATVSLFVDKRLINREPGAGTSGASHELLFGLTDRAGAFAIHGLPESVPNLGGRPLLTGLFRVSHPLFQTFIPDRNMLAPLSADGPTVVTLQPGCSVSGVVVDEQGNGLAGAWVRVLARPRLAYDVSTFTEGAGRFSFKNAGAGERRIVVEPRRHAMEIVHVSLSPEKPVQVRVVVKSGAFLSGKVVDADGKPVGDAAVGWVRPVDKDGNATHEPGPIVMTRTSTDGSFRVGPVPTGSYQLTGLVDRPRAIGNARIRTGQTDALIKLAPDPEHQQ